MHPNSSAWTLLQKESDGRPLLIRFRQLDSAFARARLHERLNIFWIMNEADLNGLPTQAESDRLKVFENLLVEAVEHDGGSVLSAVLTCNGKREFVFYTADVAVFLARLTDMPQEEQRYPIELHRNDDSEWEYFDHVTS